MSRLTNLLCSAYANTVNHHIDNYDVVEITPQPARSVLIMLVCPNSNCISHAEPVSSSFAVKKRANDIALKCKYCEKRVFALCGAGQLIWVGYEDQLPIMSGGILLPL